MGLNRRWIFPTLYVLWLLTLLALGTWWAYLILSPEALIASGPKLKMMIKWEGGTFFMVLLCLSITLFFLYIKDIKKTKSLQNFFGSLTHELKTPLASIRLQADVIHDLVENQQYQTLKNLTQRLIEDTQNLETQMDKILQLSRIERGGVVHPRPLDFSKLIQGIYSKWGSGLQITIRTAPDQMLWGLADEFASELILRNLFENTRRHSHSTTAQIEIMQKQQQIIIHYQDQGDFKGDMRKLGHAFYSYNSGKGNGIGLYLCKKLMQKMQGKLNFVSKSPFAIELIFPSTQEQQ